MHICYLYTLQEDLLAYWLFLFGFLCWLCLPSFVCFVYPILIGLIICSLVHMDTRTTSNHIGHVLIMVATNNTSFCQWELFMNDAWVLVFLSTHEFLQVKEQMASQVHGDKPLQQCTLSLADRSSFGQGHNPHLSCTRTYLQVHKKVVEYLTWA